MPNNLAAFAIHADDVQRARLFYERVFDWRFEPWGPPGFYLIRTGDEASPGVMGLLQGRQEPRTGTGINGFECTISVDDVAAIATKVEAAGVKIIMPAATIPTVGTLIYFLDTEGNKVGAMKYDTPPGKHQA